MLYPQANLLPELDTHNIEDGDMRKRAKYLEQCNNAMWNRWTREYARGLRERHNLKHSGKKPSIAEGDVVLVQGEKKDRNYWKLGIVNELVVGRDGIVRAAKLRSGKGMLERAIQHLYPLELLCDWFQLILIPIFLTYTNSNIDLYVTYLLPLRTPCAPALNAKIATFRPLVHCAQHNFSE